MALESHCLADLVHLLLEHYVESAVLLYYFAKYHYRHFFL